MKIKFLYALFILFSINLSAQPPLSGSLNYSPCLTKFEGTWKWSSGASEITFKLKKVMYYRSKPTGGFSNEVLFACYKYIKNGIIVEDNLSLFTSLSQNQTGLATLYENVNPNIASGVIRDSLLNKYENLELTFNEAPVPFLNWYLYNREKPYNISQSLPDNSTTLPKEIILIKQP